MNKNVPSTLRGRFAPSPSGYMHLGNAWTALLAWLQVRSCGGVMVLRMEDLDPDRCRLHYATQIMEDMRWLGMDWDEGPDNGGSRAPYSQNKRRSLYEQAVNHLTQQGLTYPCYCTRSELRGITQAPHRGDDSDDYPGTCRNLTERKRRAHEQSERVPSIRVNVPSTAISFCDLVRGYISEDVAVTCGDFVIRRSDGVHAYQLAVVIDDALMGITHVLRGDDLLASTPRQLLLYKMLGLKPPQFAHVPLLYGTDGHRLSKRQKGVSIAELRARGVTAQKINGYLAYQAQLIDQPQAVAARDLISVFDLRHLPPSPVVVDISHVLDG